MIVKRIRLIPAFVTDIFAVNNKKRYLFPYFSNIASYSEISVNNKTNLL